MNTIQPKALRKIPGRPSIQLSEEADDEIRFQFHLLLAEKIYPTIAILLERLLSAHKDFPVRSETTFRRHIHRLGFTYQMTSKVKVLLDDNSFVAQRACYFRKINELRKADALILFHDETWVNINEEKRSIWVDDSGKGRLRKTDGKGTRLGISAMIDKNGFHLPSVDIFDCSKDHSMTSSYFSEWIKKAAFRLREDNVAQEFDVQIVRLPVRHCSLNPIELTWAALKDYIRKNNTNFTMSSVYELAAEFIAGFDDKAAQDAIRHAKKLEMTYKTADNFVENIVEPQLIDDVSDTEIDNLSDDSDDSTDI
ncbi:unnamed protein product [Rotaria sp. Silwood2]|nr:unnamed protein product [Rotaria sp. Silwood2]